MSLKAKIEAVIYASEEPVTLAQLAGLLGHEAQAELDHLDSAQQALVLENESAANPSESEAEHAEAHRRHLHDAAVEEGAHFRAERLAVAAATAAMTSGELEPGELDPVAEPATEPTPAEQGSEALAAPPEEKDEKKLARETREKERRLREYFRTILDQLIADYVSSDRGLEIREVAGGYRFATKPEYHDAVRGFVKSLKPALKLSLQALETLAVIAYKQPVTAPEISEIRGVDSSGVLGSLISRKLITTAGRKQVIGRPILYKTTKDFLMRFGLKDVAELPSIEEFEKMAGQMAEQEEISAPTGQMPFANAEADDEDGTSTETDSDPEEAETKAAAAAAVRVSDESASREFADLPGVAVEAEVKPTEMVDAGEATSSVGQPGEGD